MLNAVKLATRDTLALARPYWTSDEKLKAWLLLSAMIALQFVEVYATAQLTYALAGLFDALDAREFDKLLGEFLLWGALFALFISAFILELNLRYQLIVRWRQFLTGTYLDTYLSNGIYNQVELNDYGLDNPDQRIAADINNFVTRTLDLSMALLGNIGRLFAFGFILWTVSGDLPIPLAGRDITIPGYMFWVAVIYAVLATYITHLAGRRLIPLKFKQQQFEADFRYHLTRIREHSDSVAFASGGPRERKSLMQEFDAIKSNWLTLLRYERRVLGLGLGFGQLSSVFPYLAALPALMAGTIALGGVIQLSTAFTSVANTLSWFARSYSKIADWKASVDRVISLDQAMKAAAVDLSHSKIERKTGDADALQVQGLTLEKPNGETLISEQSFVIPAGQNTVLTGKSGSGKTTLFRAIAGQWVWGSGQIELPRGKVSFVPQTSYLPKGSLRSVLTYPGAVEEFSTVELQDVLKKCGLPNLVSSLDDTHDLARNLSGGEKQCLAFARVLLSRPDWLFMDEATSAMDAKTEQELLLMLSKELPKTTCVLIAHGVTHTLCDALAINITWNAKSVSDTKPLLKSKS